MSRVSKVFVFMLSGAALVVLVGLSLDCLGEHKLCEGMTLKQAPGPGFTLSFDGATNLLRLQGALEVGVLVAVEQALAEHPETTGIILQSEGGNIYQGRGLANLILDHGLSTYVHDVCYSACALAYTAGLRRYLGAGAKLGFHAYRVDSGLMQPLIDVDKEQAKDLAFYRQRLPDTEFIKNIFLHHYPDIWIPDTGLLLKAGVVHELIE